MRFNGSKPDVIKVCNTRQTEKAASDCNDEGRDAIKMGHRGIESKRQTVQVSEAVLLGLRVPYSDDLKSALAVSHWDLSVGFSHVPGTTDVSALGHC